MTDEPENRMCASAAVGSCENAEMSNDRPPRWLHWALAGLVLTLIGLEIARPLRRRTHEPKLRRDQRNAVVGGIAAATVQLFEVPVVMPLAAVVERRGWGLLPRLGLPSRLEMAASIVALDYTLYLWHVLTHRVPVLWRFHAVHHADLDMDVSTAIRFHFGELLLSVPWRATQVLVLGVRPQALAVWQTLTLMSICFHHSNARLPRTWERWLGYVLVTPRMHGIHHSRAADEVNSNWSSGLSLWDRMHGTLRVDVPQSRIDIGVDGFDDVEDVTLPRLLAAPFTAPVAVPGR